MTNLEPLLLQRQEHRLSGENGADHGQHIARPTYRSEGLLSITAGKERGHTALSRSFTVGQAMLEQEVAEKAPLTRRCIPCAGSILHRTAIILTKVVSLRGSSLVCEVGRVPDPAHQFVYLSLREGHVD
ncbi:MAG: hypothetical protein M3Z66_15030 [Chloroflexota bacterium]|nr:hypothetical protein [Chloroflexota bacterium]